MEGLGLSQETWSRTMGNIHDYRRGTVRREKGTNKPANAVIPNGEAVASQGSLIYGFTTRKGIYIKKKIANLVLSRLSIKSSLDLGS